LSTLLTTISALVAFGPTERRPPGTGDVIDVS